MTLEEFLLFVATVLKWYLLSLVVFGVAAVVMLAVRARRRRVSVKLVNRINADQNKAGAIREFVRNNKGGHHAN